MILSTIAVYDDEKMSLVIHYEDHKRIHSSWHAANDGGWANVLAICAEHGVRPRVVKGIQPVQWCPCLNESGETCGARAYLTLDA